MGTKPHFLELFTCKLVLGQWSFMNFLDLKLISMYAEKKGIFVCVKLIGFPIVDFMQIWKHITNLGNNFTEVP